MKKIKMVSAVTAAVLAMSVNALAATPLSNSSCPTTSLGANAKLNSVLSLCDKTSLSNLDINSLLNSYGNIKGLSLECGTNAKAVNGETLSASIPSFMKNKLNTNCKAADALKNNTNTKSNCINSSCSDKDCSDTNCSDGSCKDKTCVGLNCSDSQNQNQTTEKPATNDKNTGSNSSSNVNTPPSNTTNNSSSNTSTPVSAYATKVVELVNAERAKAGLGALKIDNKVTAAAQVRAKEIKTSFSHTRPDGTSCFTALDQAGASYKGAGENIALGQQSPEKVVSDWMNSEGHRANIMNANFKYIGVGVDGNAWTQLFTY